jgi:protein-L-isoaspartate(D-aspartate) O-methyltransferase
MKRGESSVGQGEQLIRLLLWTLLTLYLQVIYSASLHALDWPQLRKDMVNEIRQNAIATASHIGKSQFDPRILDVMASVPRHQFVPVLRKPFAYYNRPLPIGYGQTISQPYIVALMTDLIEPKSSDVVLEVGTGSGYQAAVLSRLVKAVYTIEIISPLSQQANERFAQLGYSNVHAKVADGFHGWEEIAPFDSIIVTAAGGLIPPPLIRQLKPGGRMAIPVGGPFTVQHLMLVEKDKEGEIVIRQILPVRFVPLTGVH